MMRAMRRIGVLSLGVMALAGHRALEGQARATGPDRDVRAILATMIDLYAGTVQDSVLVGNLGTPLERADDLRVLVFHAFPGIDAETLESFENMVVVGGTARSGLPGDLPTAHPYRLRAAEEYCGPRKLTLGPVGLSPSGQTAAVFSDHWAGPDMGAGVTNITFLRRVDEHWEKQSAVEAHLYTARC